MSGAGRRVAELQEKYPGALVLAVTRTPELRAALSPTMAEYRRVPAHPVVVAERGSGVAFWRGGRRPRQLFVVPWARIAAIETGERRAAYGVKVPVVELHLTDAPDAVIPFAPASRGLSSPTPEQVAALATALQAIADPHGR